MSDTLTLCKSCLNPIEEGAVVSFGDFLFHVQCFNCAKCGQSVDKKANLLLLDSKPICDNCAYTCTMCHTTIQDEAITAGDKAYHAHCFQCISCKQTIQDLVFTQTTKGIYCTPCYHLKKQQKKKKKTVLPTPAPSPNPNNDLFSDVSLDFFDSEVTNLSDSLGINLDKTPEPRLSRASELLRSSLRDSVIRSSDEHSLQARFDELEANYASLQVASEQVLEEFNQLQEDFALETKKRKQYELVLSSYPTHGLLSRKELDRLALLRIELESACQDLIRNRDSIMADLDDVMYQKSLKTQIQSLIQERDCLLAQTKSLTLELEGPPSPSSSTRARKASDASSVLCKVSSRHSFMPTHQPTLFRLKKKGSTLFHKLKDASAPKQTIYHSAFNDSVADLGHAFQSISFIRPVPCGVCQEKIWGRSDYRCDRCHLACHARCVYHTSTECVRRSSESSLLGDKVSLGDSSMFGYDLIERAKEENRSVPYIVEACIQEVEKRGLDFEGIYRKSGGAAQIRAIQLGFEQGDIQLSDEEEYNDIGAITSVLKQYFRDLPDPLLTMALYDSFTEICAIHDPDEKLNTMKKVLHQLPKEHFDTAIMLFQHLCRVHEQVDKNRMSIKNLAMVFAPTLMRHPDPSRDFLDISYKNATIEFILFHLTELLD
ncbi:hypothetical protein EDC96DRAFT_529135 [Choanephora cucurbitarum]|nr:hypothetical protein EDC96DRAFT_529135 [Choanephora cucurbitarum]